MNGESVIFKGAITDPNRNMRFSTARAARLHSPFKSYWLTGVDVPQPYVEAHRVPSVLLCAVLQI